MNDRSD